MNSKITNTPLSNESPLVKIINDAVMKQVEDCKIDQWMDVLQTCINESSGTDANKTSNYYICHAAHIPIDLNKKITVSEFKWDPEQQRLINIAKTLGLDSSGLDMLGSRTVNREKIIPFSAIDLQHTSICQLIHPKNTYRYMEKEPEPSPSNGLSWNYRAQCILKLLGIEEGENASNNNNSSTKPKKRGFFSSLFGSSPSKKKTSATVEIEDIGLYKFDCTKDAIFTGDCMIILNGGAGNGLVNALMHCDGFVPYTGNNSNNGGGEDEIMKTDTQILESLELNESKDTTTTTAKKGPMRKIKPPSMPLPNGSGGASILMQELGGETQVRNSLKGIFGQYDQDGDGHIDTEELFSMMIELHLIAETQEDVKTPNMEVAKSVMAALDTNKNGTLELSEFESWMAKGIQQSTKALNEFKTLGPQYEQLHNFLVAVVQQIKLVVGAN